MLSARHACVVSNVYSRHASPHDAGWWTSEKYPGEVAVKNRRILLLVALVGSIGIALTPATAEAVGTNNCTVCQQQMTAGEYASFLKAHHASSFSPLSKSVFRTTAVGHATGPNPGLAVELGAYTYASHSIYAAIRVNGLTTGTATVSVSWGDGTPRYATTITPPADPATGVSSLPTTSTATSARTRSSSR
jgi:hypothetical protein